MANHQVLPVKGLSITTTLQGRVYSATAGVALTVPDFDARVLAANGWVDAGEAGPTVSRPANPPAGYRYIDTTLGKTIIHEGPSWRDPVTGATV